MSSGETAAEVRKLPHTTKPTLRELRNWRKKTEEDFSYLRTKDEQKTCIPRLDLIVCAVFVAALIFGYINARYLHWI